MKSTQILLLVFLAGLGVTTQAYATDTRLMTDAEYKNFLREVDNKLPVWEVALKKIDPAKSDTSYAMGNLVVQFRDIALMGVENTRQLVAKQRIKRTVSGELALADSLRGIFDSMDSLTAMGAAAGITLSSALDAFAPQITRLEILIDNDVTARVELLEKGTCP